MCCNTACCKLNVLTNTQPWSELRIHPVYVYALWLVVNMEVDAIWLVVDMEVDAPCLVVNMEVDAIWRVVDELRARYGTETLVSSRPPPHVKRRQLIWML